MERQSQGIGVVAVRREAVAVKARLQPFDAAIVDGNPQTIAEAAARTFKTGGGAGHYLVGSFDPSHGVCRHVRHQDRPRRPR